MDFDKAIVKAAAVVADRLQEDSERVLSVVEAYDGDLRRVWSEGDRGVPLFDAVAANLDDLLVDCQAKRILRSLAGVINGDYDDAFASLKVKSEALTKQHLESIVAPCPLRPIEENRAARIAALSAHYCRVHIGGGGGAIRVLGYADVPLMGPTMFYRLPAEVDVWSDEVLEAGDWKRCAGCSDRPVRIFSVARRGGEENTFECSKCLPAAQEYVDSLRRALILMDQSTKKANSELAFILNQAAFDPYNVVLLAIHLIRVGGYIPPGDPGATRDAILAFAAEPDGRKQATWDAIAKMEAPSREEFSSWLFRDGTSNVMDSTATRTKYAWRGGAPTRSAVGYLASAANRYLDAAPTIRIGGVLAKSRPYEPEFGVGRPSVRQLINVMRRHGLTPPDVERRLDLPEGTVAKEITPAKRIARLVENMDLSLEDFAKATGLGVDKLMEIDEVWDEPNVALQMALDGSGVGIEEVAERIGVPLLRVSALVQDPHQHGLSVRTSRAVARWVPGVWTVARSIEDERYGKRLYILVREESDGSASAIWWKPTDPFISDMRGKFDPSGMPRHYLMPGDRLEILSAMLKGIGVPLPAFAARMISGRGSAFKATKITRAKVRVLR